MRYKSNVESPVGNITLLVNDEKLAGLWLESQKYFGAKYNLQEIDAKETQTSEKVKKWLASYFIGENPKMNFALAPEGTPFQCEVWRQLEQISYGEITTYGEIASQMQSQNGDEKTSARAVGTAVGRNPISIIIPCHRVLGANKALTGYAGGLENKKYLLELEKIEF